LAYHNFNSFNDRHFSFVPLRSQTDSGPVCEHHRELVTNVPTRWNIPIALNRPGVAGWVVDDLQRKKLHENFSGHSLGLLVPLHGMELGGRDPTDGFGGEEELYGKISLCAIGLLSVRFSTNDNTTRTQNRATEVDD
jgi:hypothetical protein